MKKVLIFGIGGFVGSYLSREFLNHDYEIYGSDIMEEISWNQSAEKLTVKYYPADLLDARSVQNIIDQVLPDIVINLAAVSSVGASWEIPQTTISVNVVGALNIMEAARKCESRPKVMFIGSSEEYQDAEGAISEQVPLNANNPYGISKLAQEQFAQIYRDRYGMQIYCVRPFNHTGIGQRDTFVLPSFCKQAAQIEKSGKPGVIKVGNLAAERDFSDVRDIVRAYRMIVESGDCTKIFNVGSGKGYSLNEMLEYIVSLSSQKITVEVDQDRFRPVDTPRICCDYSFIRKELGWEPEYSIFDTLKEMFLFYCREE